MKYLTTILIILILSNIIVIYDTSKITTRKRTQDGQMGEPTNRGGFVHSKEKEYYEETVTVTAYPLAEAFTDSTPCIPAFHTINICNMVARGECAVASSFLPLGTYIRLPSGKICRVVDRFNSRYKGQKKIDIAFKGNEVKQARKFGTQEMIIKIIK